MITDVMKISELEQIKQRMNWIKGEDFQPFVASILSWYQKESLFPSVVADPDEPPNIFDLFEYPNSAGEATLNYFCEPKQMQHMSLGERDKMMHDCALVLDAYHMFYCYKDDTRFHTTHLNNYVVEVW